MSLRLNLEEYSALCALVANRDEWKCKHCGFRNNLHVHHIIYRSQGGADEMSNLVTLCNACHEAVHRGDLKITSTMEFERKEGWKLK